MSSASKIDYILLAEKCLRKTDSLNFNRVRLIAIWDFILTAALNVMNITSNERDLRNFFRKLLYATPLWESDPLIAKYIMKDLEKLINIWVENLQDTSLINLFDLIEFWKCINIQVAESICDVIVNMFENLINGELVGDNSQVLSFDVIESISTNISKPEKKNFDNGQLIFVNNFDYGDSGSFRFGHEKDSTSLTKVAKELQLTYKEFENMSASLFKSELNDYLSLLSNKKVKKLLFVVCGHGLRDNLTNNDYLTFPIETKIPEEFSTNFAEVSKIPINEILSTVENFTYLQNVPKVFLFQCCREFRKINDDLQIESEQLEVKNLHFPSIRPVLSSRHNTIIIYACLPGHLAYRSPHNGSFLIQDFCSIFGRNDSPITVSKLIDELRKRLKMRFEAGEFVCRSGIQLQPMYLVEHSIGAFSSDFQIN